MILLDRYMLCLKNKLCPITGSSDPLVFQSTKEDMRGRRVDATLNVDDVFIWVIKGAQPVFLTNIDVSDVLFESFDPDWELVLDWSLEIAEVLGDGGFSCITKYLTTMPDTVWYWLFGTAIDSKEKARFVFNIHKRVVPSHGRTYGALFAQKQSEAIIRVYGKEVCDRIMEASGPSVALSAAQYSERLRKCGESIHTFGKIAESEWSTHEELAAALQSRGLPSPRYRLTPPTIRKWLNGVTSVL